MSLQFVLGNSGFGKTKYLYEKIIRESMESPDEKYYCIVPEQFTMQTQRDFVMMHPRKGIAQIDVLSFQRLAFHVLDEVGESGRVILEETGKNIVLRKIAQKNRDHLKVLGRNMKKPGYISEVKSLISEFTQYRMSTEMLEEMIVKTKSTPLLSCKLQDVLVLYREFLECMGEKYMTSEQVLQVLNQVLDRSQMLKESIIVLDGFTAFSPIQLELIKGLLKTAKKIYVTATIDSRLNPYEEYQKTELFYLSKKMIQSVTAAAKDAGIFIEEPVRCLYSPDNRFKDAEDLGFLEQHLFRGSKETFQKDPVHIHLTEYQTAMEEAQCTVSRIHRLVREGHYRYGEIAVVLGNEDYREHLGKLLKQYEIPAFLDEKRSAMEHPFVEFLRALLMMIEENFSYETVFRYLRGGFSGISTEETDILENYVLALGIRGFKKYETRWLRFMKNQSEESLQEVNEIRDKFQRSLCELVPVLREERTTIREKCSALYAFLEKQKLQLQLKEREIFFEQQGEAAAAKEYHQIFKVIMDLLDKYVELLGDEQIPLGEFRELLEAGFAEVKVGVIPPGHDRVVVGDMERTRLKDVRVLFFLGMNEGNIPKSHTGGGILSQMERERLEEASAALAPTAKEQVYLQKFYLYYTLTKPSGELYLSYCTSDFHGAALRPSYLKEVLEKMYPALQTNAPLPVSYECLETEREGMDYLSSLLAADTKERKDAEIGMLISWYEQSEKFKEHFEKLWDNLIRKQDLTSIGKAAAGAIYGDSSVFSVTRLERYAACAYAHFLQYGLRLKERELYEFAAVDMGTLLHKAVELFAEKVKKSGYDWLMLTNEQGETLSDECIDEVITDYHNTILYENSRNEYMITRMRRLMKRTIWALTEHLKRGAFIPDKLEAPFFVKEGNILLKGRIDRIDICEDEDKVCVRVLDYKSGNAGFDMTALYNGLQLQLAVYLNTALEIEKKEHPDKKIIPAGLFYFPIKDPIVELTGEMTEEERERALFQAMAMDGRVNSDTEIIYKMDRECRGQSEIMKVSFNKDGSLSKSSKVLSTENFQQIGTFVKQKIAKLGAEILEGEISVNPYSTEQKTACDFCAYRSICKFSPKDSSYRRLEKCQWE
ncbi:MAG: PD-(D/E)XK nuclease family protein [Lachnospiraceae bacterium]